MREHQIWFWQLIISPHMAGLAKAMADRGHWVVYVAQHEMTPQRAAQGWQPPSLGAAQLRLVPDAASALALAEQAPPQAVHICQGIRGNGQIGQVQRRLAQLGRRQWVVMETVDDSGWRGIAKRLAYRLRFSRYRAHLEGVLATGLRTRQWVIDRGMSASKVYPFAYFLPEPELLQAHAPLESTTGAPFKVLFVGQFIQLKRLDLLIDTVASMHRRDVKLVAVGSGPLDAELQQKARQRLGDRVQWIGRLPMADVHKLMAEVDCLVLPSRYDGWGAVVVEALMAGTPAICSDRCGAAEAVLASGVGGVFGSGDVASLTKTLSDVVEADGVSRLRRQNLASWSKCFSSDTGAQYLGQILHHVERGEQRPAPPWSIGIR
ncbi:glycosyltransferase family 4 protein [Haliea salexigens]|uniref:glycosyltransferase family 4 protein n=1 Tax=Haliea salexigens TaxID=287487 RepID=UPI0004153E72|nr:glycosyltransferase [Haliea salexigens]